MQTWTQRNLRPLVVTIEVCVIAVILGLILSAFGGAAHGSSGAPSPASTQSALRHRSEARWHAQRVHAAAVRESNHDRSYAHWVSEEVRAYGPYWLSGLTTNTPQWWCIRVHEEGGQAAPANEFGFVPFSGWMSAADQSALALSIWHRNGDKWGPTAWTTAAGCGLP